MAKPALSPAATKPILAALKKANAAFNKRCPGDSPERQPVHTVYGGAHLFKADTAPRLGELALKAMATYAPEADRLSASPDEDPLAAALGLEGPAAARLSARVAEKLRREPVEDFRIDFEDGYGNRSDAEEDGHAASAAEEVAKGAKAGTLPPFIGIRIKTLSDVLAPRSLRTLDIFVSTLATATKGRLPANFVVTLPKLTSAAHVTACVKALAALETKLKLPKGSLKLELMIETPQSVFDAEGRSALPAFVAAGQGRIRGAHFGTYDYTALMNVTAAEQKMGHPSCDFAKNVMQVSLAQTGVTLSDGATNVMPVPIHRAAPGRSLTEAQEFENAEAVHRAWKLHFHDVQHSLVTGYYQGWDLHPAQLVTRYAAVYYFFLSGLEPATARLKNFVEKAAQATLVGDVFDDAATGQGLLNYFLRGLNCGAITESEAAATGLTRADFQSRSFLKILENRRRHA